MEHSHSIHIFLHVLFTHVRMAAIERVSRDQGSLYGQGSLKEYQEALSHQRFSTATLHYLQQGHRVTVCSECSALRLCSWMILLQGIIPTCIRICTVDMYFCPEKKKKKGKLTLWRMSHHTHMQSFSKHSIYTVDNQNYIISRGKIKNYYTTYHLQTGQDYPRSLPHIQKYR